MRAIHTSLWNLAAQKDTEMKLAKVLLLFVVLHFRAIANPKYTIIPNSFDSLIAVGLLHSICKSQFCTHTK